MKQAIEDNLRSAADLPYFEGDYWPNVFEESIKELDQEEEEKRKQAEAAEAAANAVSSFFLINLVGVLVTVVLFFVCSFILSPRKVKLVLMAKRRIRKKRKKAINPKQIKGRIAKNQILPKRATIFPQRFSPQWKNTKRSSLSLDYIQYKWLLV